MYECAIRVEVGVGSGDVEVDIIYITFMMRAQYTGLLGTVKSSHYNLTYVYVINPDRGVLK